LTTSETVSAYAVEGMTCSHCAAAVTDDRVVPCLVVIAAAAGPVHSVRD
jgi:hypothetical protein